MAVYRVAEVEESKQDQYVIIDAEDEAGALAMGKFLIGNELFETSEVYDDVRHYEVTEVILGTYPYTQQ